MCVVATQCQKGCFCTSLWPKVKIARVPFCEEGSKRSAVGLTIPLFLRFGLLVTPNRREKLSSSEPSHYEPPNAAYALMKMHQIQMNSTANFYTLCIICRAVIVEHLRVLHLSGLWLVVAMPMALSQNLSSWTPPGKLLQQAPSKKKEPMVGPRVRGGRPWIASLHTCRRAGRVLLQCL